MTSQHLPVDESSLVGVSTLCIALGELRARYRCFKFIPKEMDEENYLYGFQLRIRRSQNLENRPERGEKLAWLLWPARVCEETYRLSDSNSER